MADIIKKFVNGKVTVRRGEVTATVDPRCHGMRRWTIVVRPPGRFKPKIGLPGYRVIYGPFAKRGSKDPLAITEQDAFMLAGNPVPATMEDKLAMAQRMLDWYFAQDER